METTTTKPTINTKRSIIEASVIATLITAALLAATHLMGNEINWIETLSVFFSFACTWLCTRQVRFNYVLAVAATILLSITFYQSELYGSMALNLYLIPTVIYGWFIWGKDTNSKPVEHVKPKSMLLYAAFTAATWAGAYSIITYYGGQMVALDGWLLVGTVLAQFLLDRKKLENWIVWILVDVVSIYVYYNAGLYLLAAQFVFFLANAVYAWFQWRKHLNTAAPKDTPASNVASITDANPGVV